MIMYGFSTTLDTSFDDAISRVTKALGTEGFGILTDIDVKATLKAKLDIDRSAPAIRRWRTGRSRPTPTSGCCCPAMSWSGKKTMAKSGWVSWIPMQY